MKRWVMAASLAVALCAALPAAAGKFDSVVEIRNDSDWAIHELYISSDDENEWGPDQLGQDIIEADGGSYQLHSIPCDSYDIRLVDEDGDECVVGGVPLCGDSDVWRITNDDLLSCQVQTQ